MILVPNYIKSASVASSSLGMSWRIDLVLIPERETLFPRSLSIDSLMISSSDGDISSSAEIRILRFVPNLLLRYIKVAAIAASTASIATITAQGFFFLNRRAIDEEMAVVRAIIDAKPKILKFLEFIFIPSFFMLFYRDGIVRSVLN